jgi:hypothetical protein
MIFETDIQEIFVVLRIAILTAAFMIIPYSLYALSAHEKTGAIRATRRAGYGPMPYSVSLWILTWIVRWNIFGMVMAVGSRMIRYAIEVEPFRSPAHETYLSFALTMFSGLSLLFVLVLPAVFLLWTKARIMQHYHEWSNTTL